MISCAEQPESASNAPTAFRTPWVRRFFGRSAASHHLRNRSPKPNFEYGCPLAGIKKVSVPVIVAASASSSGRMNGAVPLLSSAKPYLAWVQVKRRKAVLIYKMLRPKENNVEAAASRTNQQLHRQMGHRPDCMCGQKGQQLFAAPGDEPSGHHLVALGFFCWVRRDDVLSFLKREHRPKGLQKVVGLPRNPPEIRHHPLHVFRFERLYVPVSPFRQASLQQIRPLFLG